jgi:phage-related protein
VNDHPPKPLEWIASSRGDLKKLPDAVQDAIGFALYVAQEGGKHPDAKPLRGFGPGVLEVVANSEGNAFRAAYTVRFAHAVYVLHVFQKKSTAGVATPKHDIDLIETRLRTARAHYALYYERNPR